MIRAPSGQSLRFPWKISRSSATVMSCRGLSRSTTTAIVRAGSSARAGAGAAASANESAIEASTIVRFMAAP